MRDTAYHVDGYDNVAPYDDVPEGKDADAYYSRGIAVY